MKKDELTLKRIRLFIRSRLLSLSGVWEWDLRSDELFCSDVIFGLSDFTNITETKCLIHPEDVLQIEEALKRIENKETGSFHFRVITTYGEVRTVRCLGILEMKEDVTFLEELQQRPFDAFVRERKTKSLVEQNELELKVFRHAEQMLHSGIWYINTITFETYYSDGVYRIHGLPPQSLNAHFNTFTPFIHPHDRQMVDEAFEGAYQQQLPIHIEYRILVNGDEERHVSQTTRWMFNDRGELILSGIIKDITEEKTSEQYLSQVQDQLNLKDQLLNFNESGSRVGFWYINLYTRKTVYSDNIYRIYGLKPQTGHLTSKLLESYVHPDDQEVLAEANRQIYMANTPPDVEFRIVRKDGKIRHLRYKGNVIINSQKEMVMLGTIEDFTEQLVQSKKLNEYRHQLEVQNFTYSQAEEMAGIGNWMWDLETGEIRWSNGIYQLLGYRNNSIQLSQKILLRYIHPDDRKIFTEHVGNMLAGGTEISFDFRIVLAGDIKLIRANFKLTRTDGKMIFVGTVRDVTKEKQLQQQLTEQVRLSDMVSDAIVDRVFVTDTSNYIIKWNKCCEVTYGIKKEKAIGQNVFDVLPAIKTPDVVNYFHRALAGESIQEKEIKEPSGLGYYNLLMVPIKSEDDEVIAVMNVLHDTTYEHKLRQELTDRLVFIEKLLAASVDRVIVMDQHMNYLYWNNKAEEYYGLPKEEVLGKNILEVFPGFINDPSYNEFKQALKGEMVHIPSKDSGDEHNETYLIPLKDEKQFVNGVLWIVHDLTEIRHAHKRLAETEEQWRALIDHSPDAITRFDKDFKVISTNATFARFLNNDIPSIVGKTPLELNIPGGLGHYWILVMEEVFASGETIDTTHKYDTPEGERYWFTKMFPEFNTYGEVTSIGVISRDITEIKKAEDGLRGANERLALQNEVHQYAEQIGNFGTWTWHPDTNKSVYSVNMFRLFGMDPAEPTFENIPLMIHPDDRSRMLQVAEEMRNGKEQSGTEYRIRRQNDGVERILRNKSKLITIGNERLFIGTTQDITDEVSMRERLAERTRFAELIIDSVVDRMIIVDTDYIITGWNKRCEEWYHYSKVEIIGRSFKEIFPMVMEDATLAGSMEQSMKGEYVYLSSRKEIYNDGFADVFFIPLKNDTGKVYAVLFILHDVTKTFQAKEELRALNITLERSNRELERKNEEITTFAFVASHDLKEPIRKLNTFSEWLLSNEVEHLTETGHLYLRKMADTVKRLESLIEDILAITHIHTESLVFEPVDLNEVLQKVIAHYKYLITNSGTIIKAGKLPMIKGNESHLFYLVKNLISNAIKFQREGSIPIIEISVNKAQGKDVPGAPDDEDYISISFKDNGLGFDNKYARKIFVMFQRLHGKEYEGTGMGLAICKKIMENHNGFIGVRSEPGKGSVFTCYFPAE